MKNVIKQIISIIDGLGYSVFLDEKDIDTDYPFVILKFPSSTPFEYREDYIITLDIWTVNKMDCIDMTDAINQALNRYHFINEYIQFTINKVNQINNIKDEDAKIKRNQLKYIVKAYKRA